MTQFFAELVGTSICLCIYAGISTGLFLWLARKRLELLLPYKQIYKVQIKSMAAAFLCGISFYIVILAASGNAYNVENQSQATAFGNLIGLITWYMVSPKFYLKAGTEGYVPIIELLEVRKINRRIIGYTLAFLTIFGLVLGLIMQVLG